MSVSLRQTGQAAFTDKANESGIGLQVDLAEGCDGQYLAYDTGSVQAVLHVRVMFRLNGASGGVVSILRGLDAGGHETFRLDYDAGQGSLTLVLVTGESLSYILTGYLPWHCVECAIDCAGGEAKLYVNGLIASQASGSFGSLLTKELWLGGFLKDSEITGTYDLDDWIIADEYIGPSVVQPASEYGDDPARWLVVYNLDSDDLISWANSYRIARDIAYANLLGLSLGSSETVNEAAYDNLRQAIVDYLSDNGLGQQVIGILLGHGVPGYTTIDSEIHAIADLLQIASGGKQAVDNPLTHGATLMRPSVDHLAGCLMTARIDGNTADDSLGLISLAQVIEQGLGDGNEATVWLQPYAARNEETADAIDGMVQWAGSVEQMLTRLPVELSAENDPGQEVSFSSICNDGFFWGWVSQEPGEGFFAEAGDRVYAYPMDLQGGNAGTLHSGAQSNLIEAALGHGYAAAAGSCRAVTGNDVADVQVFFEALRLGWTLAEAWFASQPRLGVGLFLTGDPLMRAELPTAGWNLYGPGESVEKVDLVKPIAAARDHERQMVIGDDSQPGANSKGYYVIRHCDLLGRSEASTTVIHIANHNGDAQSVPLMPVWPIGEFWPVVIIDKEIVVEAIWEKTFEHCDVARVDLVGEVDGGPTQTLASTQVSKHEKAVVFRQPMPGEAARYCWRLWNESGVWIDTPWSMVVAGNNACHHQLVFAGE